MSAFRSAIVTGATGFLGSALVRRLSAAGIEVICPVRSPQRVTGLSALPGVKVRELVSVSQQHLAAVLNGVSADVIFHLASYGVHQTDRDPQQLIEGNVLFLTALLELASSLKIGRFIHAGSCSEYAFSSSDSPIPETQRLEPASLYGAAKAASFLLGNALARELAVPFLTLRLFGIFGPHEASQRLIPYLIARLHKNQPVDLTPGEQVRDFLFEDDAVDAFLEAAKAEAIGLHQAYNVCSSRPVTVRSMGEMVAEKLGKSRDLLRWGERRYRRDEPMYLVGDNRRFVQAASWHPRITFEQGVDRMIKAAEQART